MTSATLPTTLSTPFLSSIPSSKQSRSVGAIICSHPKRNMEPRCSLYLLDSKSCIRIADPMLRPSGWCHSGVQNSRNRFGRLEGSERRSQKVATNAGSGSYWITVAQAFGVGKCRCSGYLSQPCCFLNVCATLVIVKKEIILRSWKKFMTTVDTVS